MIVFLNLRYPSFPPTKCCYCWPPEDSNGSQ